LNLDRAEGVSGRSVGDLGSDVEAKKFFVDFFIFLLTFEKIFDIILTAENILTIFDNSN